MSGEHDMQNLFAKHTVETIPVAQMAEWCAGTGGSRLVLPPIQRSFVWDNERILNYWDSLMRGYPAGMMMVRKGGKQGRDLEGGRTQSIAKVDFQLFDGQQRLGAILLGMGKGYLAQSRRIWVDIDGKAGGDRMFPLRINSTGQPFGYRANEPNRKAEVWERRKAYEDWNKNKNRTEENQNPVAPQVIFEEYLNEEHPIQKFVSDSHAIRLDYIIGMILVQKNNLNKIINQNICDILNKEINIDDVVSGIRRAFESEIIVSLIDENILDGENYPIFFTRIGQGGVRLSDDELVYSLVKDRYPHIHDRINEIVQKSGRFASEIDLVLGALRVSRALASSSKDAEEIKPRRPTPSHIHILEKGGEIESYFLNLLPEDRNKICELHNSIMQVRACLLYDETLNPYGLPTMLLARLPHQLLDVLLLFMSKKEDEWTKNDRETLIAFVMAWLLFSADDDKVSFQTFMIAMQAEWKFDQKSIAYILNVIEEKGFLRHFPRKTDWKKLEEQVQDRETRMLTWAERFTKQDKPDQPSPGEALRFLSTHEELKKRALMWLQRFYIAKRFFNYDPTSARDEDLPFDLDHIIPHILFGFRWSYCSTRLNINSKHLESFRNSRDFIGNSLGNLRWLSASDNRSRGKKELEKDLKLEEEKEFVISVCDVVEKRDIWNELIKKNLWNDSDIKNFQKLIDERTLKIIKKIMCESGIFRLIEETDKSMTASSVDLVGDQIS